MIGLLVGAAAIAGLIAFKRRHHRRWAGMGPGCGHGGWHHHRGWGDDDGGDHPHHHRGARFARWGRRRALYAVLGELDCSPAQERMIREEVDGLLGKLGEVTGEKSASREDLARAVGGAELDRKAFEAMFARHDQRLVELRGEVVAALGRVHAVLDDKQRARLGQLISGGPRSWRGFGPYR